MVAANTQSPRFQLGQIVATPGAVDAFEKAGQEPMELLRRHVLGDWGEIDDEDRQNNEDAVVHGARIMSVYRLKNNVTVWLVTEADRSVTTFLLPSEY